MKIKKTFILLIISLSVSLYSCAESSTEPTKGVSYLNSTMYALDFEDLMNGIFFNATNRSLIKNQKYDTTFDFSLDYYFNYNFLQKYNLSFDYGNYEKKPDRSIESSGLNAYFSPGFFYVKTSCYPYEKLEYSTKPIIHTEDSYYYNTDRYQSEASSAPNYIATITSFAYSEKQSKTNPLYYNFITNGIEIRHLLLEKLASGYYNYVPFISFPKYIRYDNIHSDSFVFIDDNGIEYSPITKVDIYDWFETDRNGLQDSLKAAFNITVDNERINCVMFCNIFPDLFGIELTNNDDVYYEIEKEVLPLSLSYYDHDGEHKRYDTVKYITDIDPIYDVTIIENYKIKIFIKHDNKDYLINQLSFIDYNFDTDYRSLDRYDSLVGLAKYEEIFEEYGKSFKDNIYKISLTDEVIKKSINQNIYF